MAVLICILEIIVLICSFAIIGRAILFKLALPKNYCAEILAGFFSFFAIYSIFVIPCIFYRVRFTYVVILTVILWLSLLFTAIIYNKRNNLFYFSKEDIIYPLSFIGVLLFGIQFYYTINSGYVAADTVYYVSIVQEMISRDTMYINWNTISGMLESTKYSLCSFYVLCGVLAKIGGLKAMLTCKVVGGGLCQLLALAIIYMFGVEFFSSRKKALLLVNVWILLNTWMISICTNTDFLIRRANEAKAWGSNIVIPSMVLVFFCIYKDDNINSPWWKVAFIISVAGVAISESTLIMGPMIYAFLSLAVLLKKKKIRIIRNMVICQIPMIVYVALVYGTHILHMAI